MSAPPLTSRQRLLTALRGGQPDRLPVTTHHLMPYFLETYMGGMSAEQFFDAFGLDAIRWACASRPNAAAGEYLQPADGWIASASWRIDTHDVPNQKYPTTRHEFATPSGVLSMVQQWSRQTAWVTERLIKRKSDIDLIARYATAPLCDVEAMNTAAEEFGERGIVRGTIPGFEAYGQPGCWQDAAVLYGIEALILETYDDPAWVHTFLDVLRRRKLAYIDSLSDARFDLIELGGGDASSTVISPRIFDEFVAPYDRELIAAAHHSGQRIVYHTCGGMMPLLERIADMGPDAMETFTPPTLGGDTDLAEAKRRIGRRVCMIGGFDQCRHLRDCPPHETRRAVRDCFAAAGAGGGFILSPSDHFFDADPRHLRAMADEARACTY